MARFIIDLESVKDILRNANGKPITINLPISIDQEYHNGKTLKEFICSVKNLLKNGNFLTYSNGKSILVDKIQLDVGDILNRHNWYYKYCEEYIENKNLSSVEEIPEKIKRDFEEKAYQAGDKQGKEWFINNIRSINELIPKEKRLSKGFVLNDEITTLFEGDKSNPKIEYIRYKYWLNNAKYKDAEKAIRKLYDLKNPIIENSFQRFGEYFYEMISQKKSIKNKGLFIEKSLDYLKDEIFSYIALLNDNVIIIYPKGDMKLMEVFRGKKAQNDSVIRQYLEGPLKGADQRKFVSVKMIEE